MVWKLLLFVLHQSHVFESVFFQTGAPIKHLGKVVIIRTSLVRCTGTRLERSLSKRALIWAEQTMAPLLYWRRLSEQAYFHSVQITWFFTKEYLSWIHQLAWTCSNQSVPGSGDEVPSLAERAKSVVWTGQAWWTVPEKRLNNVAFILHPITDAIYCSH